MGIAALGKEKEIGSLETGKKADLLRWIWMRLAGHPPREDVYTALVYSVTGTARHPM